MITLRRKITFILLIGIMLDSRGVLCQNKHDFLEAYDLFYFDKTGDFTKNGEKINKGGQEFTPDILYSDGSFLSSYSEDLDKSLKGQGSLSEVMSTSSSLNSWRIFFQGRVYESYYSSINAVRDGRFIYYVKCEKEEYIGAAKRNCCVRTALYANDTKIDEADVNDLEARVGVSDITPLFAKKGILYYAKTVGDKTSYYSYNPINQNASLFKPELFNNNDNELLGILDNGDIIFTDSLGIFRNNLESMVISATHIGSLFIRGAAVGNSYYCFTSPSENNPHGFLKDNLLIANVRSDTYGRTIDADEEDCHFGNYIYGYLTPMQGVNREGTVVRMDKRTNKATPHDKYRPSLETDIAYFVNSDMINFSPYWKTGGNVEKSIQNLSFVFNEKGNVSSLVVTALDESVVPNIYLVRYLGNGKIGPPEILVRDATLFGVAKKPSMR